MRRHARVSRLVRERFGLHSHTVLMQTSCTLPRLAHKLGPGAGGVRGLGELELQPLQPGANQLRSPGMPHEAVEAWVSTSAGMAAHAHQWQLDTTSLQLTSTELEVGWAERGSSARGGQRMPEYDCTTMCCVHVP